MVSEHCQSVELMESCCGIATETPAHSQADMVEGWELVPPEKSPLEEWWGERMSALRKLFQKKKGTTCSLGCG